VGEGGRNDPNIVCTYELKKKKIYSTTTKININKYLRPPYFPIS
jgi:hypothetical protein